MKKAILSLVVFFSFIGVINPKENNIENILLARGYTKCPKEISILDVYQDAYDEIFKLDYRFQKTGIRTISLVLPNEFEYRLYYVLERK
jgi:hypothetical protein